MNTEYTPGPWAVGMRSGGNKEITANDDGAPLATVYGDDSDEQCWPVTANARLIAAAPDLLAALQGLGAKPDGYCFCANAEQILAGHTGECREACAAIDRATKETP